MAKELTLREKQVEALLKDPVAFLRQCYIDEQPLRQDAELLKLILLAKILEKIH